MLQADVCYQFINEACAELMACEYFDLPVENYTSSVERLRVLMEIIGSDAILQYNFAGDFSGIYNAVKPYLSEEDYATFINIMLTNPGSISYHKELEINQQLDSILANLYRNKFGRDISDDMIINAIYNGSFVYNIMENYAYESKKNDYQRYYFNSELDGVEDNYLYFQNNTINEDGLVIPGSVEKIELPSIWEKFSEDNYEYLGSSLEDVNQESDSRQVDMSNNLVSKSLKLVKTRGNK